MRQIATLPDDARYVFGHTSYALFTDGEAFYVQDEDTRITYRFADATDAMLYTVGFDSVDELNTEEKTILQSLSR